MHKLTSFMSWYFYQSLSSQFHFINNSLIKIEDLIGITTNIRYFLTPIYGDRTWVGRSISLVTRSSIIISGAIIFTISAIILISIPITWVLSLIIFFRYPIMLLVPLTGLIYYHAVSRKKPTKLHPINSKDYEIVPYCDLETKKIITATHEDFFLLLQTSPSVKHFIQRTLLPVDDLWPILNNEKPSLKNLTTSLFQIVREQKPRYIRPVHLFEALLLMSEQAIEPILKKNKLDSHMIRTYAGWEEYEFLQNNPPYIWDEDYSLLVGGGTNRTWQGTVTPVLNQFGHELNSAVMNEPNKIIRTDLIHEMENGLQKNINSNILLVGEIGVGKDTLVREITQWINNGAAHGAFWSKRIIDLDIGKLFAGPTNKGLFESRVETIINEIERSTNIILYLNDFAAALETRTNDNIDLFSLLQKPIHSGRVRIIGAITPKEYKLLEQENPSFLSQFTVIHVPETNAEETASIIHTYSLQQESRYNIFFPYPNLDLIVDYAKRYVHNGYFPKKALALMEDVAIATYNSKNNEIWNTKYGIKIPVLKTIIDAVVTSKTTIPIGDIQQNEAKTLLKLEEEFKKHIVDQSDAVKALSEVLRRNRSGLRDQNKPIGTFLFVGPTGVGKTEMAKTLAKLYYGNEKNMIRLDMSEYQTQDSIDRIIGSNNLSNNLTPLTELIRRQPYKLVLLDELEKANNRILDLFLQVLDDARLTDVSGSTVDFSETIIIATSNAGTREITKLYQTITAQDQYEQIQKEIYHILSPYFRTEFLNRFDDIILFKPLTKQGIEKVVTLQLNKLAKQLYESKKITIHFSPETIENLVRTGYNVELGARPLQRTIQTQLTSKLANLILEEKLTEGQSITI